MKHRPYLFLSLFLFIGVFLHAQTLEEFPKRLSIEGGGMIQLIGTDKSVLDGIAQAGYPSEGTSNFSNTAFYFGASFRINDHFSVGYKNTMLNSSGYQGNQIVPQECRQYCFFGLCLPVVCRSRLNFTLSVGQINLNELFVRWHTPNRSLGAQAGIAIYKQGDINAFYDLVLFEDDSHLEKWGNNGAALSVGGFWNFVQIYRRLKVGVACNYYMIPKINIGPVETEFGTFPAYDLKRHQLSVELGISYLIF
jgi:hypothetical protein